MIGRKGKPQDDKEEWKELKDIVDAIFKDTKEERDKMSRHLNQFEGKVWDEEAISSDDAAERYKSRAHINMLFSTIEQIAPMLTDNKPITHVIPRLPFFEKLAWKYNKLFDYLWDALEMQTVLLKAELLAMIMKKGIVKIYYDPEKTFGGDIAISVVDPRDFFIAPGYSDEWEAPMCGVKTPRDLLWIKNNFPKAKKVEPETGIFDDEEQLKKGFKYGETSNASHNARFATVYEVWMRDDDTMQTVLDQNGDSEKDEEGNVKKEQAYPNGKFVYFTKNEYLGTMPCDYSHGLPPYVTWDDYMHPLNFLGISEIDQIEGLNKELNLQLVHWMDHTRKYHAPNYTADTNQVADIDQIKHDMHKGDQVWAVDNTYGSKEPAVKPVETGMMDPSVYNLFSTIPQLIEEVTGVTEVSKGSAEKKARQSAHELEILIESSHTRTRQKIRNMERAIKRIGYMFIKLAQQYYTEPRTTYTRDEENNIHYQTIGNSVAQAQQTVAPNLERPPEGLDMPRNQVPPEKKKEIDEWEQEKQDYEEMIEHLGEVDQVFFEFDIVVQTNSTLPMDKQSLSNLFLRLFQMKAIDAEAVLEMLQIPNRQKIIERMEKKMKAAMQANGGEEPQRG